MRLRDAETGREVVGFVVSASNRKWAVILPRLENGVLYFETETEARHELMCWDLERNA